MQQPHASEESTSKSDSGMFVILGQAALKTQQLVIAIITGLISSLVVVPVIQLFANNVGQPDSTTQLQPIDIALAVLITWVAVTAITFSLEIVIVNQINRGINQLQAQCNQIASGDFNAQVTVDTPKELAQLALSFNQMTEVINNRMITAQQQSDEQEKVKADLQEQLLQLMQDAEADFYSNLALYPEEETIVENKQTFTQPEGTLLEFLDRLLNVDSNTNLSNPQVFFGSSKAEEIQLYKDELEYREIWLQALLHETQKHLKYVTFMTQRAELKKEQVATERQKETNLL